MSLTLGELASATGAELRGDAAFRIHGVRALASAGPEDLSFVTGGEYRAQASESAAGALLVPPLLADLDRPLLVHAEPKLALAGILALLYPRTLPPPGIHPTAAIEGDASVDPSASIGPYVVIGDGARIEAGATLHAHVVVGQACRVGAGAELFPHVVLYPHTEIGADSVIHAGTVLGADGFGYAHTRERHAKLPHVGRTVIGDGVEIGALSAVDRALTEETRIGDGTKIDNLVQVGHNVTIGRGAILCGQVGIAGTAELGDFVVMGGQSGAGDHVRLGHGAQVAARSAVLQSIADGAVVGGAPAVAVGTWRRQVATLVRLPEMMKRIRALEKKLARMAASEDDADERSANREGGQG